MRKFLSILLLALFTAAFMTACGGGGGGGGTPPPAPPVSLAAGTFTKIPAGVTNNWTGLINNTHSYTHWQNLYTAETISASGRITGLALKYQGTLASAVTCTGATIKLGHTILTAVTTTFANNIATGQGGQTTVLANGTLTFPAGAVDTWETIPFTTPFDYNGKDNLIIEFELPNACSGTFHDADMTRPANATVFSWTPGAPAGLAGTWVQDARLTFTGGDNTQDYGGAVNNSWPFSTSAPLRTQNLYLASDINGSGPITGIAYQMNATSGAGTYTYSVTLSHATVTTLSTTFANNNAGTKMTVASAATFTVPAGIPAGEWFWVPIPDGTFTYNGTDNLIVEVATTSGTGAAENLRTSSKPGTRVWANGATTATGTVDAAAYHIKLRFNGGPVSVITDGGAATAFAFDTAAQGRLNLYRATELGTAGTITSIACRLDSAASTAASYANYNVIIGHSNVDALVATSSDNFVSQTISVNGTVAVPAGLVQGDWIEVPLSTPFAYDGKSNLAIWMGTTAASGAAVSHLCALSSADAARYPGQMASGAPGSATVGPQDYKFDMKLNISK